MDVTPYGRSKLCRTLRSALSWKNDVLRPLDQCSHEFSILLRQLLASQAFRPSVLDGVDQTTLDHCSLYSVGWVDGGNDWPLRDHSSQDEIEGTGLRRVVIPGSCQYAISTSRVR